MPESRALRTAAWIAFAALLLWTALPPLWKLVVRPEASAPLRGAWLASELGCFGCHGAGGRGGVHNPGSRRNTIPGFTGSTLMMYAHDEQEIRDYILDGRPKRLAGDTDYDAEMKQQAIQMPTFREVLAPGELDLLVAYIRQISGMLEPTDEKVKAGAEIAENMGCFGCHGPLGMGGVGNPGSLKGYVPSFLGVDFAELVRSDQELVEWIREGTLGRVREHWLGGWFSGRQLIQMPAYKDRLSDDEIAALVAYLRWIHSGEIAQEPLS